MRAIKTRTPTAVATDPVWCHRCSIRIAPYDVRTVHHGKSYHRDCYTKLTHQKALGRKH